MNNIFGTCINNVLILKIHPNMHILELAIVNFI